jgi:hypothetical protein
MPRIVHFEFPADDPDRAQVKQNGGEVVLEKLEVVGAGSSAYCTDYEGNVFGLWESAQISPS